MFSLLTSIFTIPELRKRTIFTLLLIIVIRIGTHIPIAGVNLDKLSALFNQPGILGFVDLFSGGALQNFSIFSLGILPYINASIIMQLLMVIIPKLKEIAEEGDAGRKQIAQYTRYLAIGIGLLQALMMSIGFSSQGIVVEGTNVMFFVIYACVGLVAGASMVMWLGEIITEKGIGNGASLIIFVGIIARMPFYISNTYKVVMGGLNVINVIIMITVLLAMVVGIVIMQEAQRKIPVQYAKRIVGRKMYGGQSTYIPMKLIQGGVLPIIFASAILQFPLVFKAFNINFYNVFLDKYYGYNTILYNSMFCILIFFFAYFYTAITFNPKELADNIKKYGGFILGVRPGAPTVEYLEKIINRLTLVGAVTLALIALVPNIAANLTNVTTFMGLGGTALLIMVGVAMDLVKQIETHVIQRRYEGVLE